MRVYECRGADPASSSDCYGSPGFRGLDATDSPRPYPAVPAVHLPRPDRPVRRDAGRAGQLAGQRDARRRHRRGDDPGVHQAGVRRPRVRRRLAVLGRRRAQLRPPAAGDTEDLMDAPWAWARRTVVPLTFQPVDDACSLTGRRCRVEGSPMAGGLLAELAGQDLHPSSTSGDPRLHRDRRAADPRRRGVGDHRRRAGDRPARPPSDEKAAGVVYSPVSITGLVVAFQIDDANGRPVTSMRLNARLVAKLITASYRSGGDPAVANNPVNLFRDPEFLKLNPGVHWPGGAPGNHPLFGDLSDTTWALTRWIAPDPAGAGVHQGTPDPWGMTGQRATTRTSRAAVRRLPAARPGAVRAASSRSQGMDALAPRSSRSRSSRARCRPGRERQRSRASTPARTRAPGR